MKGKKNNMSDKIKKTNWISSFKLVGRAKINDNSFKIDEVSQSGWCYNNLNLGVDCGEKYGVTYANLMGGYSQVKDNIIYVHGKKEDGTEDWENIFTINWDDRLDEEILDTLGDMCFIKVGLENTENGKLYTQKFLAAYDAINYIKEHLTNDTVINVQGNLKYNFYQGNVTMQRDIRSIFLSKAEPENFKASFAQSILIDNDSINLKEDVDTNRKCVSIHARVLDYIKELNGNTVKGQYPLPFTFEYEYESEEIFKKVYKLLFKVKKNIRQINFEGDFINTGATVQATMDDVTDDVKALIAMGLYTEEEILTKYAAQGGIERRYVLTRPIVRIEGDTENKQTVPQIFDDRYTEEDLIINFSSNSDSNSDSDMWDTSAILNDDDDDDSWLNEL